METGALVAGKYRILEKLGEGGMGSVWLARNEITEREFAIKFLHRPANHPHSEDQLSRFFQEAKVAGRLRHPSIVEIFDAGTETALGDAAYLVMERLDGMGLDEALDRAGALPLALALEIVSDICRGLALAHDKGIVHRDLKPSNVYLHRVGNGALVPKVLDFGISKVIVEDTTGRQVTGRTRTGAVLGSPLYMSPEQAAGDKRLDARSDVHSLGVMLWECLVGKPPFQSDTYGLLLVEIIQGERPELSKVLQGVPPHVAALVGRAMARNRDERFANAGEMAQAIEDSLGKLGHVPVLSARDGAERFFSLVGDRKASLAREGTTTTAALEVPTPGPEAPRAAQAKSAERPREAPAPASLPVTTSAIPKRRSALPALLGVGALAVGAVVVFALTRKSEPAPTPASEPAPNQLPALATTPAQVAEPNVAPVVSGEPPAPPASASTSKKPIGPAPATKPSADAKTKSPSPVHHGVTSSGL